MCFWALHLLCMCAQITFLIFFVSLVGQLLKDAGACHSLHVSAWCGDDARVSVCIEKLGVLYHMAAAAVL